MVLTRAMNTAGNESALYFICWVFIGNIVLLNLFLAILLDSFLDRNYEEDFDMDEYIENEEDEYA